MAISIRAAILLFSSFERVDSFVHFSGFNDLSERNDIFLVSNYYTWIAQQKSKKNRRKIITQQQQKTNVVQAICNDL